MPNYRLKCVVPWKQILNHLNWGVERCLCEYQRALEYWNEGSSRNILQIYERDLREACENYHALRAFLGYSGTTKAEQRAEALLNNRNE